MKNDKDVYLALKNNKERDRIYKRFSDEQKKFFSSIKENIFTFCEATSGSGKTLVSVASMLDMLANDEITRIVYIQKPSGRSLSQGYLPGSLEEKSNILWEPFYEAMIVLGFQPEMVDMLSERGLISLSTDCALRGINFDKVGVILDEAENMDTETLKLIFTRCHDTSHVVMIGDRKQRDNHGQHSEDFVRYGDYLSDKSFGNKCFLTRNFRGKFSQAAEDF